MPRWRDRSLVRGSRFCRDAVRSLLLFSERGEPTPIYGSGGSATQMRFLLVISLEMKDWLQPQ